MLQITLSGRSPMYSRKSAGPRMEELSGTPAFRKFRNHPKLSITEKRQNKAKYLT